MSVQNLIIPDIMKPRYATSLLQLKDMHDMHFLRGVLADDPAVKPNQLRSAWPRCCSSLHELTRVGGLGFGRVWCCCHRMPWHAIGCHWMPWVDCWKSAAMRDGHSTPKGSKFWTVVGDSKSFVCAPFPWGEIKL